MKYLTLSFLACLTAFGQPAAFEVASVKPAADTRGTSYLFSQGGGLEVKNGTLRGMIEMAYDVRDFQISGGPAWLNSDTYDIVAKSVEDSGVPETRRKLQALLADRFHLTIHRDTKELPVFALEVGKKGSKLVTAETQAGGGSGIRAACGQLFGTRSTMEVLAHVLSRQLGRPVVDRTALTGKYDFEIGFTPDEGPCADKGPTDRPSIFAALQEQLGLKLEPTKGPVETIVIDHAEKAAEN